MHLTEESVRLLLEGRMDPAEARALAAHLESDCPQCEALLASGPAGPIDGMVDRALVALAPPRREEAGNDLEYARIERKLRLDRSSRRRWPRFAAVAAGLVAAGAITVTLAVHRTSHEDRWDGIKGITTRTARAIPLRLSVVAVLPEPNGPPRLQKVASGESVSRDAGLQLRFDLGRPADVAVVRAGAAGNVDVIWHERVATAGSVQLSIAGHPAAYPLAGLAGPQRLALVASAESLDAARIAAAARALAPPARIGTENSALEGLSIDVLEITVR